MQLSNIPGKLVLPWATSGNKNDIPVASQIGITAGAASLTDGFPPLTMTPVAAGGVPPSGLDMNGILYEMSNILRWANAGGGYAYDSTFANDSHVGGYPKGARVMRSDGMGYWFNTVENNTTDPEAAGAAAAGWVPDYQAGATSVAMSGSSVTLTPAQYGKPLIIITGALSANLNLIFPALTQSWTVINNTTGGYSITAKTSGGSGITLGTISQIVGDGTNIYPANPDSVQIVTNVATLRNITPTLSRRIQTRGYYTDGDRGAGQYFAKVGAAPGTYVDDGGAVIVPNGGDGSSAWFLSIQGPVWAPCFGVKGDGSTDDTASIQKAINYAQSAGGQIVQLDDGSFKITDTLTITRPNTILRGFGGDMMHDAGSTVDAASKLIWYGASNGTVVDVRTPAVASNSKIFGSSVRDLEINGNAIAGIGLLIYSIFGGRFENVHSWNCKIASYKIASYVAGTIADAADLQNCTFTNCTYRNIDTAAVQNAHGFWLTSDNPGSAGANVSFNKFENCDGQVHTGRGWLYEDADNNLNFQPRVIRVTTTNPGIEIRGNTNTDSNHFFDPSVSGGTANSIRILGTASGYAINPTRCSFYMYDNGNGTQTPQMDAGCRAYSISDRGVIEKAIATSTAMSDGITDAIAAAAAMGNETLRVRNSSNNHIILEGGSNSWSVNLSPAGDLRFVRLAGTGLVNLGNGANVETSGENYFTGVQTTASAANAFLDNASSPVNRLLRSTSSIRYKKDIEDITDEFSGKVFDLRPVFYRSKAEADNSEWSYYGLLAEEVAEIEPRLVHWSYLPEHYDEVVTEKTVESFVETVGDDGIVTIEPRTEVIKSIKRVLKDDAKKVPDGVQYERLAVLLLAEVKKLNARVTELESKFNK